MSRSAEVTLAFAGEDRLFRLSIGPLRALQEKCDCGPMELLQRFASGSWRVDDLRETLLQGLKGGGMTDADATRLIRSNFDDQPYVGFVPVAQAVIMAAVVGAPDETLGEPEGEGPMNLSPEASSGSEASTDPEPS